MTFPKNYIDEQIKILNYLKSKYSEENTIRVLYDKYKNIYQIILDFGTCSLYLNPKFSIDLNYFEFAHILFDMAKDSFESKDDDEIYLLTIKDWIELINELK